MTEPKCTLGDFFAAHDHIQIAVAVQVSQEDKARQNVTQPLADVGKLPRPLSNHTSRQR
jgi:hypothetical protein